MGVQVRLLVAFLLLVVLIIGVKALDCLPSSVVLGIKLVHPHRQVESIHWIPRLI
jgi:hypothetical protein